SANGSANSVCSNLIISRMIAVRRMKGMKGVKGMNGMSRRRSAARWPPPDWPVEPMVLPAEAANCGAGRSPPRSIIPFTPFIPFIPFTPFISFIRRPPTLRRRVADAEVIEDAEDDEIDELHDRLGPVVEARSSGHDDRSGFGERGHVAELDQAERRLAR